ncbi:MAG: ABC transporter permease [Ruminococcus sp.]|nr:ABC transporter permease [Ruminococcus sp.]MCM1479713.1 ABC transporter permease [Muribaculaceae bacterium]
MSKLLRANFARIIKNKPFYICLFLMAFCGIYLPVSDYFKMIKSGAEYSPDKNFFVFILCAGVVAAFFTSMFIGTEYSCGTMRNKIAAGINRVKIYFANLIAVYVSLIIFCTAYIVPYLLAGILLLGNFRVYGAEQIGAMLVCAAFIVLAYGVIFLSAAMLVQSKASSAVGCIMAAYFLLFGGVYVNSSLLQEKYDDKIYIGENGEVVRELNVPNPNYVEGTRRKIYEFINNFLPGNQSFLIMMWDGNDISQIYKIECCSAIVTVCTAAVGVSLFRRKDIK